jgi:hypothetical protein
VVAPPEAPPISVGVGAGSQHPRLDHSNACLQAEVQSKCQDDGHARQVKAQSAKVGIEGSNPLINPRHSRTKLAASAHTLPQHGDELLPWNTIKRVPLGPRLGVTDSTNVIGWLVRGWNRHSAAVAAGCREIDTLCAERASAGGGGVTFKHVRGHNGDPLNERADAPATGESMGVFNGSPPSRSAS